MRLFAYQSDVRHLMLLADEIEATANESTVISVLSPVVNFCELCLEDTFLFCVFPPVCLKRCGETNEKAERIVKI